MRARFSGAAFLLVLAIGSAVTSTAAAFGPRMTLAGLRSGSWARSYDDRLEHRVPLRFAGIVTWFAITCKLIGDCPVYEGVEVSEQPFNLVIRGGNGWLFYRDEVRVTMEGAQANIAAIANVVEYLKAAHVHVVVVLVPSKARVVPDLLPSPLTPATRAVYPAARAELEARGVLVVDIEPAMRALGSDAYLPKDTHWTAIGARAAAEATAPYVRTILDTLAVPRVPIDVKPAPITIQANLAGLLAEPATESFTTFQFAAPTGGAATATEEPAVAVVGTSYSHENWGFQPSLAHAIGAPVLNAVTGGQGFWPPMVAYLIDHAGRLNPIVVWEVPERHLEVIPVPSDLYQLLDDTTPPSVAISTPPPTTTYVASSGMVQLQGVASDKGMGVREVRWSTNGGASGTAAGTVNWSASNVPIVVGDTVVTVTAVDGAGRRSSATLTVRYIPSGRAQ